ncbi:hypothetical protein B0H10DRAFT_1903748 [Mycena sp. CBHHK59/15]|nr:hypothetical protein B0H10DRAFT_1903748 [Mycena sp. CBHHK59/15]
MMIPSRHPGRALLATSMIFPPTRAPNLGSSRRIRVPPPRNHHLWVDSGVPRVLKKHSPSPKSTNPPIFDDDESILAQRSPRPARMLDDTSSLTDSESDSFDFQFSPADFTSSINLADSASLDSVSLGSVKGSTLPGPGPTSLPTTDADLAERARQRQQAAAQSDGRLREAPTIEAARAALADIGKVLRPPRKSRPGYIDPEINPFTRSRIEGIQSLLALYTHTSSSVHGKWKKASMNAAITMCHGTYCARVLRRLARQYITDRSLLPENPYGNWNQTLLVNEDLCNELMEYLQILGSTKDENGRESGITSAKVQAWLARADIMHCKYGITKLISLATSKRYLHTLRFCFTSPVKGQYVDGHERTDVRAEHEKVYVPKPSELCYRMRVFDKDGKDITAEVEEMVASGKWVVIWYHDESIFYAHDCHRKTWRHKDVSIKPRKKGEGVSLMVADFVLADFGWLVGPKTGRQARVILKPGKNRDVSPKNCLHKCPNIITRVTSPTMTYWHRRGLRWISSPSLVMTSNMSLSMKMQRHTRNKLMMPFPPERFPKPSPPYTNLVAMQAKCGGTSSLSAQQGLRTVNPFIMLTALSRRRRSQ